MGRGRNPNTLREFIGPGLSVLRLRDPADTPECEHGRLPLDRPIPGCECWKGFLKVKPVVELATCACGCGEPVRPGRRFVISHNLRRRAA